MVEFVINEVSELAKRNLNEQGLLITQKTLKGGNMKIIRRRGSIAVVVLGALGLVAAACGSSSSTASSSTASGASSTTGAASSSGNGKTITFGGIFLLTGPAAPIGALQQKGAELAVSEINAAGGVDGYKLKMISESNAGTATGGAQAMSTLVNVYHVPFVIEGGSSPELAGYNTASSNHVVFFNVGGASDALIGKKWLWNLAPNPPLLDGPIVNYAISKGVKKVALLVSQDSYGLDNASVVKGLVTKAGGSVVADLTYPVGTSDFTPLLDQIKSSGAQAVVTVALGDTIAILAKQMASVGLSIMHLNPLIDVPYSVSGPAGNGYLGTNAYVNQKATGKAQSDYISAWTAQYHSQPSFTSGEPFEGVEVLAQLISDLVKAHESPTGANATTEMAKILDAQPQFYDYMDGGTIKLLANHDDLQNVALQESEQGNLKTLKVIAPTSG